VESEEGGGLGLIRERWKEEKEEANNRSAHERREEKEKEKRGMNSLI
jgi:hypothetical protein